MSGLPTRTLYVHFSKMYQGQIQVVFDGLGTNPISGRDPHGFFLLGINPNYLRGSENVLGNKSMIKKFPEKGGGVQSHQLFLLPFYFY